VFPEKAKGEKFFEPSTERLERRVNRNKFLMYLHHLSWCPIKTGI